MTTHSSLGFRRLLPERNGVPSLVPLRGSRQVPSLAFFMEQGHGDRRRKDQRRRESWVDVRLWPTGDEKDLRGACRVWPRKSARHSSWKGLAISRHIKSTSAKDSGGWSSHSSPASRSLNRLVGKRSPSESRDHSERVALGWKPQ